MAIGKGESMVIWHFMAHNCPTWYIHWLFEGGR